MAGAKKIVWRKRALNMLIGIGEYVAEYQGQEKANVFTNKLNQKIKQLEIHPERYPPCRFKLLQEKGFRCFRFKNYIVIYKVAQIEVKVYGIIHERRNPQIFNDLIK